MSSNQALPTLHATEHGWPSPGPSTHDFAMLEELSFVRREAQAEADEAYGDWLSQSTADAYAVYRAAQDRADAAQDDLARLAPLVG